MFVPVYVFRKISVLMNRKKNGESDINIGNSLINNTLLQILLFENKLLKKINFPFGVSTFCIAKKRD